MGKSDEFLKDSILIGEEKKKPFRPTLPPKPGYVEQLINGVAQYVPTEETRILLEREERIYQLEEEITQLCAQLVDTGSLDIAKVPDRIKDNVTLEIGKIKEIADIKLKEGGTP